MMNKSILHKRWGHKLLLFFCAFLLILGGIFAIPFLNNNISAEEMIISPANEDPLGETIVSLYRDGVTIGAFALTDQGELYVRSDNTYGEYGNGTVGGGSATGSWRKVQNYEGATDGNKYLHDIVDVYTTNATYFTDKNDTSVRSEFSIIAVDKEGKMYGWGNNSTGILGLPEAKIYARPTKIEFPYKIKKISRMLGSPGSPFGSVTMILTEDGDVYTTGGSHYGVLGIADGSKAPQIFGFQRIEVDNDGNPMPKIKDVAVTNRATYFLTEEQELLGCGQEAFLNGTISSNSNAFAPIKILDKTTKEPYDVSNVLKLDAYGNTVFLPRSNGEISYFHAGRQEFIEVATNKNGGAFLTDKDVSEFKRLYAEGRINEKNTFELYIYNKKAYSWGDDSTSTSQSLILADQFNWPKTQILPYNQIQQKVSQISTYQEVLSTTNLIPFYVLTDKGSVFFCLNNNGNTCDKMRFGSISVNGTKTDGTSLKTAEKYNDSVNLTMDSSLSLSNVNYTMIDEETGITTDSVRAQKTYTIPIEEGKRIHQTHTFVSTLAGDDTETSFEIDLYKNTPTIPQINNGDIYKVGKKITLGYNGFSENANTATLQKDGGEAIRYTSNTAINEPGNYTLNLQDGYGNTNTYTFTITSQPIAESVAFTQSKEGTLSFGSDTTKINDIIGTFSLVYAEGDAESTIKTIKLNDLEDQFEIVNTNELKVISKHLSANTYVIPVSGTDQNDLPFSGDINLVIEKAEQSLSWSNDTITFLNNGLEIGKEYTLQATGLETPDVTYGIKKEDSCIILDEQTGVVKATCVPTIQPIFTVSATATSNYKEATIEKSTSIKKKLITLSVELKNNISYQNSITINLGDTLPTGRITSNIDEFDVASLGIPTYIFTKDGTTIDDPTAESGTYIVTATYPAGSAAEGYDITWNTATLIVNDIEINDSNASEFYTLSSNNTPYIPGTWTKYPVVITPTNDKFNKIEINSSGTKESSAFTYENEGVHNVTLTFHHDNGASISTTVQIKQDFTSPVVSQFQYTEESALRSFLRTITFDRFFSKSQQVTFTGTDTDGSGIDHYRYEIVEIKDHAEDTATLQSDTLSPSDSLQLSVNHSYRISAWAIDVAGNESTEKIERVFLSDKAATLEINATSDGSVYDGTNWTSKQVTIQLNSTSDAGVNKYQYSVNGTDFNDMSGDTITLPDPLASINDQNYTFRAINNDGTTCDQTLQMKVDPIKPEIKVQASVNGSDYDGSEVEHDINLTPSSINNNISGITYYYTTKESAKDQDPRTDSNWKKYEGSLLHQTNGTYTYYFKGISGARVQSENQSVTVKRKKKEPITLYLKLKDTDETYKQNVTIQVGDPLPQPQIVCDDEGVNVSALGTPTYTYKKDSLVVENPSILAGVYTVNAEYDTGGSADFYDITWVNATLTVEDIVIDEESMNDYFTLTSDGKPYTQGTWTNKAIIITPVHDTFNQMSVDQAENKTTNAYTYNVEGSETVKLSFYNSDGAKVSTTVTLNYDKTAPTISKFNYEEESSVRSFLRTISFDHFFGKAQQLSFTGSDETGGSGLDHYRYEIVELDKDKNELPASKKTGTLGLSEKVSLDINTSYRISAWAIDTAGNESDEKIERVFLSDEVAQLNITATSEGKNYDGTTWTKSGVSVTLSSTSGAGVEKYQYSSDGVVFHDITGATITLPDPISDVDNVSYTFKAIHNDRTESEKTLNLKVDTVKPELNITGTVNGSAYDGSLVDQNIEITMNQTNMNISGTSYYYTTSPSSKDSDPTTDSNWKRYTTPMTHSANGTFTYYFKAISGAGIVSDTEEYTVKLAKKEYMNITVNVTSEGKNYSPGNWAKGDITFTLSGGLKDTTQITGYEYTTTNGSIPSSSATWTSVTNKTLTLTENVKDQTYWFRVTPVDSDGKISAGTKVNLDVDAPSIPTMSVEEVNNTKIAQLINLFSFGHWMNKQAEVTITSSDTTSGIDRYEYIETIGGVEAQPKTSSGTITYEDGTELMLKARACDKAGNCSAYTSAEELKIDMKAPVITGVKDQSEYKQYYLPRFVIITDLVSGLKQASYKKDGTPAGTFTDNVEEKIKGEGSYEIYAIDEAGNEITITFKILKLPNIETEIDGSDESRDIIDQIIKEYEEVKDKIDQNEKDNYEQWIKDAEEKWDTLRTKVIEHEETTSKVEGQGDTTFDPKTELIVEEIPKDKVPVLPRNAIKTYDVRLMKGGKEILPNGDIKVYLPYTEKEPPIVYEIGEDGTITELKSEQEGEYVTFITDTLKKYAISNEKQKENKPDICVVGPDHKADSSDDVCGSDGSVKNEDGSVSVPEGGKVIFPDKEIDAPDGAIINPDGSVDFPDGTHFDPDGNEITKPDPKPDPNPNPDDGKGDDKPNPNPDDDQDPDHNLPDINDPQDNVCTTGPDGVSGTGDDVCGTPNKDGDKPIVNPDGSVTVPDGGSVIFPDGSEVELPDGGIINPDGSVVLPDGTEYNPDGTKKEPEDKEPNKKECTLIEKKELNIDTDGDGIPDINLDINGDCKPELNIDVNGDNVPDIDIDTTGNGKADINIDTNKDGKPDLNIVLNLKWKPNVTYTVNGFTYNSMKNLIPDLNVDDDGNGSPDRNIDTDGDHYPDVNVDDDWYSKRGLKDPNKNTVQGSYTNNTGGASTSDHTKWYIWIIMLTATTITMIYTITRKRNQKDTF